MKKNKWLSFFYIISVICLLFEVVLIHSLLVNKIDKTQFMMIALSNILILVFSILNIRKLKQKEGV
ncbi:Uncharacterised protein [Candidatus Ornithobacterium hominis]|uniref:Uncharacterized protein n=1 Tax=Candidatus Ornithobacterium hominis TaxID=2497989 RepID=A0A383U476_9FLAO|nr:Uncharacterised protein [Candidatus Ornithobacterium hominis]SZD74189.1 Uncharacterised protein [Candidatus Ornithobacterium hominis]